MVEMPLLYVAATLAVFGSAPAAAEEGIRILRGTAGLVEVPFAAHNEGPGEIACSAALAHWYSLDLGEAAPGGRVRASLWYDPKDGTVVLLNGSKDRMPVQALWCGVAGRSWATRAMVPMERAAGHVPPPIRIACAPAGGRLSCRSVAVIEPVPRAPAGSR